MAPRSYHYQPHPQDLTNRWSREIKLGDQIIYNPQEVDILQFLSLSTLFIFTYIMPAIQADFSFPGGVPQTPFPLHPSVVDKLDPVYKSFYQDSLSSLAAICYTHRVPLAEIRAGGNVIPGQTPLSPLKETFDIKIPRKYTTGDEILSRVFVPDFPVPEGGFPCFLWYHGGGHVLGNIGTENSYCSHIAELAQCIVISVDYRLAPEHPFPAAPDDAYESLLWTLEQAPEKLGVNPEKVSVGGSSAGGNLAAVVCHKYVNSDVSKTLPSIKLQLLVVPVTDCTASPETYESWKEFELTPQLPAEKMLWYRALYVPNEEDLTNPEASPLFYDDASFKKNPPAFVAVAECDVLKSEGLIYSEKLAKNGVDVVANIYKGCPHPVMVMDAVLEQGRELLKDTSRAIKRSFE